MNAAISGALPKQNAIAISRKTPLMRLNSVPAKNRLAKRRIEWLVSTLP